MQGFDQGKAADHIIEKDIDIFKLRAFRAIH